MEEIVPEAGGGEDRRGKGIENASEVQGDEVRPRFVDVDYEARTGPSPASAAVAPCWRRSNDPVDELASGDSKRDGLDGGLTAADYDDGLDGRVCEAVMVQGEGLRVEGGTSEGVVRRAEDVGPFRR